jgi:hypothetical protein
LNSFNENKIHSSPIKNDEIEIKNLKFTFKTNIESSLYPKDENLNLFLKNIIENINKFDEFSKNFQTTGENFLNTLLILKKIPNDVILSNSTLIFDLLFYIFTNLPKVKINKFKIENAELIKKKSQSFIRVRKNTEIEEPKKGKITTNFELKEKILESIFYIIKLSNNDLGVNNFKENIIINSYVQSDFKNFYFKNINDENSNDSDSNDDDNQKTTFLEKLIDYLNNSEDIFELFCSNSFLFDIIIKSIKINNFQDDKMLKMLKTFIKKISEIVVENILKKSNTLMIEINSNITKFLLDLFSCLKKNDVFLLITEYIKNFFEEDNKSTQLNKFKEEIQLLLLINFMNEFVQYRNFFEISLDEELKEFNFSFPIKIVIKSFKICFKYKNQTLLLKFIENLIILIKTSYEKYNDDFIVTKTFLPLLILILNDLEFYYNYNKLLKFKIEFTNLLFLLLKNIEEFIFEILKNDEKNLLIFLKLNSFLIDYLLTTNKYEKNDFIKNLNILLQINNKLFTEKTYNKTNIDEFSIYLDLNEVSNNFNSKFFDYIFSTFTKIFISFHIFNKYEIDLKEYSSIFENSDNLIKKLISLKIEKKDIEIKNEKMEKNEFLKINNDSNRNSNSSLNDEIKIEIEGVKNTEMKKNIGDRAIYLKSNKYCTIKYLGKLKNDGTSKDWVGVEWDEEGIGKNDGMVFETRYFQTKPKTGSFIEEDIFEKNFQITNETKKMFPEKTLQLKTPKRKNSKRFSYDTSPKKNTQRLSIYKIKTNDLFKKSETNTDKILIEELLNNFKIFIRNFELINEEFGEYFKLNHQNNYWKWIYGSISYTNSLNKKSNKNNIYSQINEQNKKNLEMYEKIYEKEIELKHEEYLKNKKEFELKNSNENEINEIQMNERSSGSSHTSEKSENIKRISNNEIENENDKKDKKEIIYDLKEGNLKQLIEILFNNTDENKLNLYKKIFFLSYKSFTNPNFLLNYLIEKFESNMKNEFNFEYNNNDSIVNNNEIIEKINNQISENHEILNIIIFWIQNHFYDFDNILILILIHFINEIMKNEEKLIHNYDKELLKMLSFLQNNILSLKIYLNTNKVEPKEENEIEPILPKKIKKNFTLLDWSNIIYK